MCRFNPCPDCHHDSNSSISSHWILILHRLQDRPSERRVRRVQSEWHLRRDRDPDPRLGDQSARPLTKHRHLEKSQWFTLGACLVLGGLTLAFHEGHLPQVEGAAGQLAVRPGLRRQSLHRRQADDPAHHGPCHPVATWGLWVRLNIAWVVFFLVCGFANLYVVFTYRLLGGTSRCSAASA